MVIKKINGNFTVCKVTDYSQVNLDAEFCFTGKTDEVPLEAMSLVMPELTALAAKQSWQNNGAEVFITDIEKNISYDGTQFATEYRRTRMGC